MEVSLDNVITICIVVGTGVAVVVRMEACVKALVKSIDKLSNSVEHLDSRVDHHDQRLTVLETIREMERNQRVRLSAEDMDPEV